MNSIKGKSRFQNRLKTNMVRIHKNLYLHPDDPLYYEKILRYSDSSSPEAHYRIAQKYERAGSTSRALLHYQEVQSLSSPFYVKAKQAVRRLQSSAHQSFGINISQNNPQKGRKTLIYAKSMLVCLLLFNVVLIMLLLNIDITRAVVSAVKHGTPGMEIVYETIDVPYIIYLTYNEPTDRIEERLYSKLLSMGKDKPNYNIQLYGMITFDPTRDGKLVPLTNEKMKDAAFVKAEYHASLDSTVKIKFQNNEYRKKISALQPLTFAAANLVRTALQTYMNEKGNPPSRIENLIDSYPNNYLSFIPEEVESGSNHVAALFDGKGGWVYHPHGELLSDMFYPNILDEHSMLQIPYEPIKIIISKSEYMLKVTSGLLVLASKPVGLGKNDQTPEGDLSIQDRALNPLGKTTNVYGKAGLGLGKYAIHGTWDEQSIRANKSLGCIRLNNKDMLEIFPLVPKGATVQIVHNFSKTYQNTLVKDSGKLLPSRQLRISETPQHTIFNWLG